MTKEQLYRSIGELDEALLERSERGRKKGYRWLAAAACALLVLAGIRGAWELVDRSGLLRMGCGALPGTIVDGVYYYNVGCSGVWRYTPEEGSSRVLSWLEEEGWQVNEYGVYYVNGHSLYVREHGTGKKRRLYKVGFFEGSGVRFSLMQDSSVVVTVYQKYPKVKYQLLLDGVTGEVLQKFAESDTSVGSQATESDVQGVSDSIVPVLLYQEFHLQVGERRLTLSGTEEKYTYDLRENGVSLLSGEERLYSSWRYLGENLLLEFRQETNKGPAKYLLLKPNGDDHILVSEHFFGTGTEDFLFYRVEDAAGGTRDTIWCLEIDTGECWQILKDEEIAVYSMITDGEFMFTCVPWGREKQTCWRLIYDGEGRPVSLMLVSEDINK